MGAFAVIVLLRLGAFEVRTAVEAPDGASGAVFDTFAGVDHPFHATRAATLLASLQDGQIPRWIGEHQGGYPAEFYPLGGPWLDVVAWTALLGQIPIVAVHKLVVIAVFLLPLAAFVWLARMDHLPMTVAATAGAAHLAVPGGTFAGGAYSGGYRELVSWGLFTNVTAAVEIFLILPALVLFLGKGKGWAGVVAACGAALAVSTNPRSSIALVALGIGVVIAAWTVNGPRSRAVVRLGLVGLTALLITAPVVVSLARYDGLYHFVRYSGYGTVDDYFSASLAASSFPLLALAIVGGGWAYSAAGRRGARSVTWTALVYILITAGLTIGGTTGGPFQQLELTRLMPFQRLLLLYLAGVGVHAIAGWALGGIGPGWTGRVAQIVIAIGVFAGFVFAPFGGVAESNRGLFSVPTTGTSSMVALRQAVERADAVAPVGSALYVVGSSLSWHQQLWTPLWTERPIRYNDWLWSWRVADRAPGYSEADGNAFRPATVLQTFGQPFLDQEGIGAVVVTGADAQGWASASPALRLVNDGLYRVYEVAAPAAIVTAAGGTVDEVVVQNERITASGTSSGGPVRIRVNWFPRWHAAVNGRVVPVERTADGYMMVQLPAGTFHVALTYSLTWWDWIARAMSVAGIVLLFGMASWRSSRWRRFKPTARWGRR